MGNKIKIFKTIPVTKDFHSPQIDMKEPLMQLQIKQDQETFRRTSIIEWQKNLLDLVNSVDYKLYHNLL